MTHFQTIRPLTAYLHRSDARTAEAEDRRSEWSEGFAAARSAPLVDRYSFTEEERWAHCRKSLRATLITVAAGMALIALFVGVVAVCVGL